MVDEGEGLGKFDSKVELVAFEGDINMFEILRDLAACIWAPKGNGMDFVGI